MVSSSVVMVTTVIPVGLVLVWQSFSSQDVMVTIVVVEAVKVVYEVY